MKGKKYSKIFIKNLIECTILMQDVNTGGSDVCMEAGVYGGRGVWKISVPPTQFCHELKTALKNKVY